MKAEEFRNLIDSYTLGASNPYYVHKLLGYDIGVIINNYVAEGEIAHLLSITLKFGIEYLSKQNHYVVLALTSGDITDGDYTDTSLEAAIQSASNDDVFFDVLQFKGGFENVVEWSSNLWYHRNFNVTYVPSPRVRQYFKSTEHLSENLDLKSHILLVAERSTSVELAGNEIQGAVRLSLDIQKQPAFALLEE